MQNICEKVGDMNVLKVIFNNKQFAVNSKQFSKSEYVRSALKYNSSQTTFRLELVNFSTEDFQMFLYYLENENDQIDIEHARIVGKLASFLSHHDVIKRCCHSLTKHFTKWNLHEMWTITKDFLPELRKPIELYVAKNKHK